MKNFEDTGIKKLISLIKAKFDSLAKVATSGSYNDLSDKPTIPSVGNGKITVKQGETTKGTFTVNQTGATTIELTDNDTHYASGTVVTNDATKTGNYGAALTNGNVYLNHVENGAVKNSHKITGSGATTVTSDASGNIIITSTDNNTTYGVATASANGLMSSTDKSKLDGIAAGAQVNQKAFSQFKVGTTEIKADTETDILTLVAGDNVTLTPDATNDKIKIAAKDTTYTSLPNPNGLRVQVNGDGASEVRYDGSEAKTINFVAGDNVTLTQKTSENKVTIAAKDTTYSAGTGLSLSGTTFNHSNSVTAGTAQGDASKTLTFGGTFTVPTVTYDAQGHVTGKGTTTMTMPANPNTDTKNTAGSTDTSSKIFLIGATSQAANPQTYSHDTAYVGTDGCLYSGGTKVSVNGHTHTKSQITDFPTSLKNPNGLRVQVNGDGASEVRYDGSVAKTINIKAGSNITITSDSSGNITISSTASAGSVTGDVGTVVYEATSGGLYCDSKTANNKYNSIAIEDSGYKYKRFRFYCQGYFGLVCTDMPLDRECEAYATGNDRGKRYGGVIFPTAENGNIDSTGIGPSNHMYYELKWRVEKEAAGWRVRVVDSGWLGFNAGITSNANYTGNSSVAVAGTNYISWNQRHNNGYCIYKIVAYTD